MNLTTKQAEALGFKGSGMFCDQKSYTVYYRVDSVTRRVTVISQYCPVNVSVADISKAQFRAFSAGKLGITPPDCCNATGRRSIRTRMIGTFETMAGLRQLLNTLDRKARNEQSANH